MPKVDSPEVTERTVGEKVQEAMRMTKRYVTSYYQTHAQQGIFRDVKTYCMFVGHARSGGSILGALLDAHPNIVIGDEVDALRHVAAGFSRDQIYHLILARSLRQAKKGRIKGGRDGKVYSYFVPGQWQGRFSTLQVIGDSKAGISTQRLAQRPTLLQDLQDLMPGINIKIIHILRNPYDTVSTMNIRAGRPLENGIDRYFSNCSTIANIRQLFPNLDILSVKHEEFVLHPDQCLSNICQFLGIAAAEEYLNACVSILYQSPARSRDKVQWSTELIDVVQNKINQFDFLTGYSFEH